MVSGFFFGFSRLHWIKSTKGLVMLIPNKYLIVSTFDSSCLCIESLSFLNRIQLHYYFERSAYGQGDIILSNQAYHH